MIKARGQLSSSRKPGLDPRIGFELSKIIRSIPVITEGDQFPTNNVYLGDMHFYTGEDSTDYKKDNYYIRTSKGTWQSMNATSLVPENMQSGTIPAGVKVTDYLPLAGSEMLGEIKFTDKQKFKPEQIDSGTIPANVQVAGCLPNTGGTLIGNLDMNDHRISSISGLYGLDDLIYVTMSLDGNLSLGADQIMTLTAPTINLIATAIAISGSVTATNFISTVATGTKPFACTSTTLNDNLNADMLDSIHAAAMTTGKLVRYNSTGTKIETGTVAESAGALSAITTLGMSGQLTNTLAIGTAPFVITSTTKVANLNVDAVDDKHVGTSGNVIPLLDGINTWSAAQTISGANLLYFRDSAINIHSDLDGWLNLVADIGVEVNAPVLNAAKVTCDEAEIGGATNYSDFDTDGVLSFQGASGIVLPHLMQSDNTDQSIASVTADQIITFDTDVHHAGITRTSSSRFTILKTASYLITFSAIVQSSVAGKRMAIWMKLNGNNVSDSATYYTFKSANATTVVTVTFIHHFAVNDYFEFWWWGDDLGIKLDYTPAVAYSAGVTPAIPACPSIIMTCNYVGKD